MSVSPPQDGCDGAAQERAKMGSGCSGGRHEGLATGLSPIRACAQCSVLVVGVAADLRETASLPRSRAIAARPGPPGTAWRRGRRRAHPHDGGEDSISSLSLLRRMDI